MLLVSAIKIKIIKEIERKEKKEEKKDNDSCESKVRDKKSMIFQNWVHIILRRNKKVNKPKNNLYEKLKNMNMIEIPAV